VTTESYTAEERLLRDLVEIPSVSGSEQDIAAYLVRVLPQWGFESHLDEAGNAIGRRGDPGAPMIMLTSHMDTVPGDIPVRQEGSILHGRGTVDCKGPLAAMICAASRWEARGAQVVLAGVVEEETFGRGAYQLARDFSPDLAIVGEPNGWSGIGIGYKGRFLARYEVSRPAAHTAHPGERATEAAVAFWNRMTSYLDGFAPEGRAFDRPIPTLNEMSGTLETAALTLSCRTPPGFDLAAFEDFLEASRADGVLTVEDRTPAALVDKSGGAVRALSAGIRAQQGRPKLKLKTGTADLNIVNQFWPVSMAVYGPGDSSLDHTDHEHIDLREYAVSIDVLTVALDHAARELAGARLAALR
jgi:[amino group carrier protein]-lysine/ornithine hydrolase